MRGSNNWPQLIISDCQVLQLMIKNVLKRNIVVYYKFRQFQNTVMLGIYDVKLKHISNTQQFTRLAGKQGLINGSCLILQSYLFKSNLFRQKAFFTGVKLFLAAFRLM